MTFLKSTLLSGVMAVAMGATAWGADLPTKKEASPTPATGPASCTDPIGFFTTDCVLSYWGVTFYGAVDAGVGWESHGVGLNRNIISGVQELIGKSNKNAMWLGTPNGLTQSFIGVKVKEQMAPDWFFVGDLTFGFDPETFSAANGPASLRNQNGLTPLQQTSSSGDSSRAGQFYNGTGYVGVSNPTFGTLTFGRQNSLSLDGVVNYDPMGASYAFSVIGWQGLTAGGGDTEDARVTTAVKYRNQIGPVRIGALAQVGGYGANNGAQAVYEGQIGGDIGLGAYGALSLDGVLSFDKGAISSAPLSAAQNAINPGTLAATISDDDSLMLLAKWTYGQFRLSGGYEYIKFQNPSSPQLGTFTGIAGITVVGADITNNAYTIPRVEQVFWVGGRYRFTDTIDTGVAYYHYYQSSYAAVPCSNSSSSRCSGSLNAVSFDVDWQFAKKFDAYAGVMFSEVNNGLANGYVHGENLAPTVGLRFRF